MKLLQLWTQKWTFKEVTYGRNIEYPVNVYVEIDKDNNIIKVFSSDFEKPQSTSIKIDEGFGDKYAHAQSQYFEKNIISENGKYTYSYIENKIVKNL